MTNTRIVVDEENNAELFWQSAGETTAPMPRAIKALLAGADEVTVGPGEAAETLAWCATRPGWDGGPAHAPHSLLFIFIEE